MTRYPCHLYEIRDGKKAYEAMQMDFVKDYGDDVRLPGGKTLHDNYTWDDGGRCLLRCRECGGYFLCQSSEYHDMFDGPDGYYKDWIPAASAEDADLLNILLDVMEFENYPCRHLRRNNHDFFWTQGEEPIPHDLEALREKILKKYPVEGINELVDRK
ncbi:MAG: hypothetical protein IJ719_14580 [Clostridia bacterium]|nr:hypothetical protein [Clostridia bacterium]